MSKIVANGWRYARSGPMNKVLQLESFELQPKAGQAVVKITHAPLHRLDAGVINGSVLGRRCVDMSPFPRIAGCEGVGVVTHIARPPHTFYQSSVNGGTESSSLEPNRVMNKPLSSSPIKEGDVVWISPLNGTWASHAMVDVHHLFKIKQAHTLLATNASVLLTAHQLLSRYVRLKDGQVILQNGGSSLTALAVAALMQNGLADKHLTLITACTPGERFAEAKMRLSKYRNSHVVEYNSKGMRAISELCTLEELPEPVLYLNGVSGREFDTLLRCVGTRGHVVTYGAQNGIGLFISSGVVIEKELTLHGHFMPSVLAQMKYDDIQAELSEVLETLSETSTLEYPIVQLTTLEELPKVWDSTFLSGGSKAIFSLPEKEEDL